MRHISEQALSLCMQTVYWRPKTSLVNYNRRHVKADDYDTAKFLSAYLDGHACAMKPKRKQHLLSSQTVVGSRKFRL